MDMDLRNRFLNSGQLEDDEDKYDDADEDMQSDPEYEENQSSYESDEEHGVDYDNEPVLALGCKGCKTKLCSRAMRVVLIADNKTELYSTDERSSNVAVNGVGYTTQKCLCEIRDVCCLQCGNVIGYHVCRACISCLGASNNGHYWLFQPLDVQGTERFDDVTGRVLTWGDSLTGADARIELMQQSDPLSPGR